MSDFSDRLHSLSPQEREYALLHLPGHWASANNREQLRLVLTNLEFLEAKVAAYGPQPLIEDYEKSNEPDLKLIQDTLRQAAHILARDPVSLPAYLYNALYLFEGEESLAGPLIAGAREALVNRSWLRVTNRPRVGVSRKALVRVMEQGGSVQALAWSPNGHTLASAGGQTVRLWDAATGSPGPVLERHFEGALMTMIQTGLSVLKKQAADNSFWDINLAGVPEDNLLASLTKALKTFRKRASDDSFWDFDLAWALDAGILISHGGQTLPLWNPTMGIEAALNDYMDEFTAIAWSPDGHTLATGGRSGVVYLWDPLGGELLAALIGHLDKVDRVAWVPSGETLASSSLDGAVRVWNPKERVSLAIVREHRKLAKSSAGGQLADEDISSTLQIATQAIANEMAGRDVYFATFAYSPDSRILATGGEDRKIRLWDTATWQVLATLEGHTDAVRSLVWAPDNYALASVGEREGKIRLWEVRTHQLLATFDGHSPAWSANGALVALVDGKKARLWELPETKPGPLMEDSIEASDALSWLAGAHTLAHTDEDLELALSPDERILASGGEEGAVALWDVVETQKQSSRQETYAAPIRIHALAWSPDGSLLASGGDDNVLRFWDADGVCVRMIRCEKYGCLSLAWAPDSRRLITGGGASSKIWNLEVDADAPTPDEGSRDKVEELTLGTQRKFAWAFAWAPNGFLAGALGTGRVVAWNGESAENLADIEEFKEWVQVLAWSPDSRLLASGGENQTVRLHDPATGKTRTLAGSPREEPKGIREAIAAADRISRHSVCAIAWSANGRVLASGGDGEAIKLWDVPTGKLFTTLEGHSGRVRALCWAPNGGILASAGEDRTIILWDIANRQRLLTVYCLSPIQTLQFSQDGRFLRAADDGTTTGSRPIPYVFELCNIDLGQSAVLSLSVPKLLEALRDEHHEVRQAAADAFAKMGSAAVPELLEALRDEKGEVRGSAALALGVTGDTAVVPTLIERLSDIKKTAWADQRICDVAAKALESIGTPNALAAVEQWRKGKIRPSFDELLPVYWRRPEYVSEWQLRSDEDRKLLLKQALRQLPDELGSLEFLEDSPGQRFVVLVTYDEESEGARKNAAQIFSALAESREITFYGTEGAWGALHGIAALRDFPDKRSLQTLAEQKLRSFEFQPLEYAAIICKEPILIWGIEDRNLYQKALNGYRAGASNQGDVFERRVPAMFKNLVSKMDKLGVTLAGASLTSYNFWAGHKWLLEKGIAHAGVRAASSGTIHQGILDAALQGRIDDFIETVAQTNLPISVAAQGEAISFTDGEASLALTLENLPRFRQIGDELSKNVEQLLGNLESRAGPESTPLPLADSLLDEARAALVAGSDFAAAVHGYIFHYPEIGEVGRRWLWLGLASARVLDHRQRITLFLNDLGAWYGWYGKHKQPQIALRYLEQALPIQREMGNQAGEAETLYNMGLVYMNIGQLQRAIELFEQALVIMRQINDRRVPQIEQAIAFLRTHRQWHTPGGHIPAQKIGFSWGGWSWLGRCWAWVRQSLIAALDKVH